MHDFNRLVCKFINLRDPFTMCEEQILVFVLNMEVIDAHTMPAKHHNNQATLCFIRLILYVNLTFLYCGLSFSSIENARSEN